MHENKDIGASETSSPHYTLLKSHGGAFRPLNNEKIRDTKLQHLVCRLESWGSKFLRISILRHMIEQWPASLPTY